MKRSISLILTLAMLILPALAACSGEGGTPSADTAAADAAHDTVETAESIALADMTDGLEDRDMNGWELSILNWDGDMLTWANVVITPESLDGDTLNDAIYQRNADLCERFNISIRADDSKSVQSEMARNVTAGDDVYTIYLSNEAYGGNQGIAGHIPYALDWQEIPCLSLDSPWWNPDATSVYKLSGHQVALAGNCSLTVVSRAVCMVFNKVIWEDAGTGENLYSLVDSNKWTVDKYLEVTKEIGRDLNGDGVMDKNDLWALNMGRGFKGYTASFLAGSGMNYTEPAGDGSYVFSLDSNEKALTLLAKLVDALAVEGYCYNEDASVHSFAPSDHFKNSHALFTQGVPNDIYKLRDMEDDIGLLPMPKHDESQENFYSAAWGGAVWTLARTFDMDFAENLGMTLEAMSFAGWRDVIPVYKEIALKTKTARDNESEAMLDIIFGSIYFDFGTNICYDAVLAPTFLTDIWHSRDSGAIVSAIEKYKPKINQYITDLVIVASEM